MSSSPTPADDASTSARKAGIVSVAIFCSRILGLVREVFLGGLFGGSKWMDAFMVAFRTPNMLRDLFAEGALSTAFVTTFSQQAKREGEQSAFLLARKVLTLTAVAMAVITVIGYFLAPVLVRIFAAGWVVGPDAKPELIAPTVYWTRIIYCFIPTLSVAALVMGILNSRGVFFVPAIASSFFNLGSILAGILLGYWLEPEFFAPLLGRDASPDPDEVAGRKALTGMAVGVVFGGICQLGIQLPSLRRVGFRFRPDFSWNDPGVKRVLTLMAPAVISGSAVQVGVAMNTFFASFLREEGSVSYLMWAFRLMQLPIGIFGVAIATVTLPAASRAAADGPTKEFRGIIARGLRLNMLVTIPSAIGLAVLAEPIIAVIWQRGRFDSADTLATAAALRSYALGLVFYSAIKILQPTFYSIDRKWVPMWVSIGAITLNAALNSLWIFVFRFGHEFLALSTTLGSMANFTALYLLMLRFAGRLETGLLFRGLAKIGVAATVLTAVAMSAQLTILEHWADQGFFTNAGGLALTILLAGAGYFWTAKLLRVEELDQFAALVRRKVKRS